MFELFTFIREYGRFCWSVWNNVWYFEYLVALFVISPTIGDNLSKQQFIDATIHRTIQWKVVSICKTEVTPEICDLTRKIAHIEHKYKGPRPICRRTLFQVFRL